MPVYEYKCEKGHITEVIQSIREEQLEKVICQKCRRGVHYATLTISRTAAPVLKKGIGGFYKPTRD